jgi:tetratricopeptide (TPR) repeat protein
MGWQETRVLIASKLSRAGFSASFFSGDSEGDWAANGQPGRRMIALALRMFLIGLLTSLGRILSNRSVDDQIAERDARKIRNQPVLLYLGQPEAAIPNFEKGIRLSPHDPNINAPLLGFGLCELFLGRVDQAVDLMRKARAANPGLWINALNLAGALGFRGDLDEARAALADAIKLKPEINSEARLRAFYSWATNPQYWALREKTLNVGLRRAGFPDE